MNILVDMDDMKVLHKHPDSLVIGNLAWIECRIHKSITFDYTDRVAFKPLTDMEIKMLYRNTFGEEPQTNDKKKMFDILYNAFEDFPISDVRPGELEIQANKVSEEDEEDFKYIKGSRTPGLQPFLFEERTWLTTTIQRESSGGPNILLTTPLKDVSNIQPKEMEELPVNRITGARNVSQPKKGSKRDLIWETADSMWEAAGKPLDKKLVLELRKKIMDELETGGIKRTSASSELGNWHKIRAPF